jgi:hypothetical protein
MVALAAPLASAQEIQAPRISVGEYAAALEEIAADVRGGRLDLARTAARDLERTEVAWAGELLAPDPIVLAGVVGANDGAAARRALPRLDRLAKDLRAVSGDAAPVMREPSPRVLDGLAPPEDPQKGGTVTPPRLPEVSVPQRAADAILAAWDVVVRWWRAFWDWLESLVPARVRPQGDARGVARVAVIFTVVAIVLLVVLAVRAARGRRAAPAQESVLQDSAADEDPLSRETSEWERHARELAAALRFREAIRAWYHAVLTALFRRGELHYRKGRTNWEYVAGLSPQLAWRGGFIALTRQFDREWYGRRTSDREAHEACAHQARLILDAIHASEAAR